MITALLTDQILIDSEGRGQLKVRVNVTDSCKHWPNYSVAAVTGQK